MPRKATISLLIVPQGGLSCVSVAYFLAKTEPSVYSIDRLRDDKRTTWDGIKNPQALRAVRQMRPGDRVFIYHSGGESAVVGLAEVLTEARPDPKDPKLAVVDVRYITHIDPPTKLADIKSSRLFDDWSLVRQGRLSTMAAPVEFVQWMRKRYPGNRI
jgi:predicted RNA-binding protein with PUA-like domain